MTPRARTYHHLASARRIPSEYEITSTALLWYPPREGFELDVPLAPWYAAYQRGSPLAADFEAFADPRETTYFRYVALQRAREVYVDQLLRATGEPGYAAGYREEARACFEQVLVPMRHVWHGLQMVSAYVGQLAPAGRIVIAAGFEAADHLRRVQRIAQRMVLLWPDDAGEIARRGLAAWQDDPAWQPLRRTLERLLVTWDWAEALVALNVVLGPALDRLVLVELAATLRGLGDPLGAELLGSLDADGQWHRAWTRALLEVAVRDRPENAAVITGWVEAWRPSVEVAVDALVPRVGDVDVKPRVIGTIGTTWEAP